MDFMGCMSCGLRSFLEMIPLRWNDEGDMVGFALLCDTCIKRGLKLEWSVSDDEATTEEEAN